MHDSPHPAWAARAWQHWHRPWAVTDGSWLCEAHRTLAASAAHELALRWHYAAWCRRYGLERRPPTFQDSTCWQLLGLQREAFERVALRIDLALAFALEPRRRLIGLKAAVDVAMARWALGRAHFMPDVVLRSVQAKRSDAPARRHALAALRPCALTTAPPLWPRLRLRFPREQVQVEEADGRDADRPAHLARQAQTHLGRLWNAALREEALGRHPEPARRTEAEGVPP